MSKIINLSSKTKEEIISKFASFSIKIHDLNFSNFKASFRPGWMVVGPVEPDYVDDRMRKYRGRYGEVRSD